MDDKIVIIIIFVTAATKVTNLRMIFIMKIVVIKTGKITFPIMEGIIT